MTATVAQLQRAVQLDGIAGLPGAFAPAWAARLGEDFAAVFAEALARPQGTLSRGPHRHYLAVPPERVRGFVDLAGHPVVTALCARMLGPGWTVVELGFDVPLPGAVDQPWHRDFPMPADTRDRGVLTSLAVNVSTVTVTPEMGPLEIVPGSQWEDGADFEHGMFPPPDRAAGYAARATRRLPALGDASVRTGLAVHRGTANRSGTARPVLVLGAVAAHVDTSGAHDLMLTRAYAASLPAAVRAHLRCTLLVDELVPLPQRHDIEGLKMGS
ncbi:MAG: phytanoyl-CoA dioxygenase family protein [Mycobacteriales bacterium]